MKIRQWRVVILGMVGWLCVLNVGGYQFSRGIETGSDPLIISEPELIGQGVSEPRWIWGWAIDTDELRIVNESQVSIQYTNLALTSTGWGGLGTYDLRLLVTLPDGSSESYDQRLEFGIHESREWQPPFSFADGPEGLYTLRAEAYLLGGELSSWRAWQVHVGILRVETIDPYFNLMNDGETVSGPEQLGSKEARLVSGLVADGVTPVVIRAYVAGPGAVKFSIKDESGSASHVGFLSTPAGNEQVTSLTVDADELTDGGHMAFAVLTAPPAFFRGPGDENLEERPITIEATFTPSGGDDVTNDREIQLVRPPVIMVHGLWSDASAFSTLDTELSNKGFMFLFRPSYSKSGPFSENDWVLPHLTTHALNSVRSGGYACRKVDIVGHSMGGLLAKRIQEGFAQQNVRKIITIGSPYLGSPLADRLYNLYYTYIPPLGRWLEQRINWMRNTQKAISGGAIADLRTNNSTPTQIPGVDCQNIIVGLRDGTKTDIELNAFVAIICAATGQLFPEFAHDLIFGPDVDSDWVVSESSQQGGEPSLPGLPVAWHGSETKDSDVLSLVLQALNQPAQVGQSMSLDLAPDEDSIEVGQKSEFFDKGFHSPLSELNGTVEIMEPNEGQICTPGQSITVSVQGSGDTTHAVVFAHFGSASWGDIIELPWQGDVNVPVDCVGSEAQVVALGLDPNMNITDQDEVNLVLDTNVVLEDIFFGFGDRWTFDFKAHPNQPHEFQLYPLGVFSDGSEHPLSVLSEEIIYESYSDAVASVDPNGLVTAHSKGTAVVTTTCSSKTTSLVVEVDTYPGDLNLSGTVDYSDVANLANQWLQAPSVPTADISPEGGDGMVNFPDFAVLANHWFEGTAP